MYTYASKETFIILAVGFISWV